MTTREVADYLRVKERRVYELVRQRQIPCTRVTGKWLFPRTLIDLWLSQSTDRTAPVTPPPVISGSHDPLLEWAVGASRCGLALNTEGSLDGLNRFLAGESVAAGIHLLDADTGTFNVAAVAQAAPGLGLVVLAWARREQGLVVAPGNPKGLKAVADLAREGVAVVRRQDGSGSHRLLGHLLERAGIAQDAVRFAPEVALNETELGMAILQGRADAGVAVRAAAAPLKLDFVPLRHEDFDLVMRRRDAFEPPLQRLFAFARTESFRRRAADLGGYDVSETGQVRFNGP
jgi:putative molybdopterin biosynthesis protein